MAKDAKKKKADKKARVTQKQEKKSTQKEKKHSKKAKDEDSDAEDADLDAILAEYQKQQEQFLKVTETPSDPPTPRASAALVPSPSNNNEIFLFGGEYFNGALASFFNDLYVYKTNSDSWRKVNSPNSPLPRSGHAMCQGGNAGGIYLFGGEFSSPKQGTFYHYNDFWRLEPGTREWSKVEGKGGPPARSGHRMTYFKNYIVLFGGFQDTSQQTKYMQDVWMYDTQRFTWFQPALPPAAAKPDARSSFSFLPHETGAVLYGGYSRVKVSTSTTKANKGGGKGASRVTMKPVVHQDTWFLRITPPPAEASANTLPSVRWERRKRPVNSPNPPRAGATMAHHKGRGISFGGVHDVEESEEGIDSEFFNLLYAYNIDRNRFFQLSLRRPRTSTKKGTAAAERGRRGRGKADEEELLRNLALIEGKSSVDVDMPDAASTPTNGEQDEPCDKVEKPTAWEMPHPRFNAQLAVQEDVLYIYGGTFEKGDREYTFDEMWAIDLGKLDGVKEVFKREISDWHGSDDEDSEDDDDEDGSDEDEDDEDEGSTGLNTPATSVAPSEEQAPSSSEQDVEQTEHEASSSALSDTLPHPRPFESLREFFARTSNDWQETVIDWIKYQRDVQYGVKEIRKRAFERAEQKWWDCREEIQALEDEQEAAGISEVVSLDQRAGGEGLYKADKGLRRYATTVERALGTWETAPQEWADYIAFLGRLLKAIQTHPKDCPILPHSSAVSSRLAQCLNPALPSGAHQKALEVYTYIISTFGLEYLSAHLQDYLPGLSAVLSFASSSVRPGLYALFEEYVVQLPSSDLRPALKSLLLSLLPAIEEETSEDFDRAYAIVGSLERKFTVSSSDAGVKHIRDGYFWQCLFLCVVTSPTRRQGALNYLTRSLPRFASKPSVTLGDDTEMLSPEADTVTSPEPGLLVRCFVAGLSDPQTLIQRGFLDLLVTHLPLHSPVLWSKVQETDLDLLVSAATSVLLRRETSLNRRLWTWFLGPETTDEGSPVAQPTHLATAPVSAQHRYFETYGQAALERCALAMFAAKVISPSSKARPFRICLSLLDRWEIGGPLISRIFLPAMESLYSYSLMASTQDTAEVLRSASLFFDGVEANIIWMNLTGLLHDAFDTNGKAPSSLDQFQWIVDTFNVKDEEMATVHVPLASLQLLSLLHSRPASELDRAYYAAALRILVRLLELVSAKAFDQQAGSRSSGAPSMTVGDICEKIDTFYRAPQQTTNNAHVPFQGAGLAHLLFEQITDLTVRTMQSGSSQLFCLAVPGLLTMLAKAPVESACSTAQLQQVFAAEMAPATHGAIAMPFLTISSTVTLMTTMQSKGLLAQQGIMELSHAIVDHLWRHMSPTSPKYHVEAVKTIWQLDGLVAPDPALTVCLLSFIGDEHGASLQNDTVARLRRFMTLWNHTLPSPALTAKASTFGVARRGSAIPNVADAAQTAHRLDVLSEPLLLVLDALQGPTVAGYDAAKDWIAGLPSLDQVFVILIRRTHASLDLKHPAVAVDIQCQERQDEQGVRNLVYYLELLESILRIGNDWVWDSLVKLDMEQLGAQGENGAVWLAQACMRVLVRSRGPFKAAEKAALRLLDVLISGSAAAELKPLDLDSGLLDRLITSLEDNDDTLQCDLLRLIPVAMKLRLAQTTQAQYEEQQQRGSFNLKRRSSMLNRQHGNTPPLASAPMPPPRVLQCIRMGFTSQSARFHLDQWVSFLASILPPFADAIFASLIPLVECFCAEIGRVFGDLLALTSSDSSQDPIAPPDVVLLSLLEALELVLARAHDSLLYDGAPDTPSKPMVQTNSFLGSVTSGVFRAEGPPSKTSLANSRLTVILAFQDSIRTCLRIWEWSSYVTETSKYDITGAATTAHYSLRLRNKARYLLEEMFSVEPLESLEVVMSTWLSATRRHEAAAALSLLQVMQGSRPQNVVPAILDALCSRTNPGALLPARQSSQTEDLAAVDVALFLLTYLDATEDDAMDEVWTDCVSFLRDVLANPWPHRLVLPPLLSLVRLLARKMGNTNFGEQRKMRRELGDIFQRLLVATFTALPSSFLTDAHEDHSQKHDQALEGGSGRKGDTRLLVVLRDAAAEFEAILETPERITTAVNTISTSLIVPAFRSKSFPSNISPDHLSLLLELARKAPNSRNWKKELADVFNDARLLASPLPLVVSGWMPLLQQWTLRDKDRMTELLARLAPPSTAGIMFGVGASAARLEADRRTQLNLRRICLLLLASSEDAWVAYLRDFDEKLVELSSATHSSSPSSTIKAELFMLCMALVLSLSPSHLSPLWPSINNLLRTALAGLDPTHAVGQEFNNLGLLQGCKLLDQLVALSPDDFQLHEWLYITDTVNAVYRPDDWSATALADQVAEALGPRDMDDSQTAVLTKPASDAVDSQRRLLLGNDLSVDKDDVKALARDEFAKTVLRPFLNQLSIHAYEGVYSMDSLDVESCRQRLLEDVLDTNTIVE
ncbi:hypothetical protein LTR08_008584 [Meristemomyces frigidus]|nr:hypothetical protein LTR08_008584 [Meristemomyces frigidus]